MCCVSYGSKTMWNVALTASSDQTHGGSVEHKEGRVSTCCFCRPSDVTIQKLTDCGNLCLCVVTGWTCRQLALQTASELVPRQQIIRPAFPQSLLRSSFTASFDMKAILRSSDLFLLQLIPPSGYFPHLWVTANKIELPVERKYIIVRKLLVGWKNKNCTISGQFLGRAHAFWSRAWLPGNLIKTPPPSPSLQNESAPSIFSVLKINTLSFSRIVCPIDWIILLCVICLCYDKLSCCRLNCISQTA